jgi:signal transduction histidine kinase
MTMIPNRAPIAYSDLRRPYNLVRAAGAFGFILCALIWAVAVGAPRTSWLLLVPAGVVAVDAVYRRASTSATALPGLVIDATAIGIAMALRGPDTGVHAVAIITILVTSGFLLPAATATVLVVYATSWSILVTVVADAADPSFIGVLGRQSTVMIDAITIGVFIAVTAWVLFLSVRVILAAQDRQEEALAQERRAVQLKNEFVSMVSHELRTPLTGIAGFTETLADTWTTLPSREVDEFLAIMGHETDHLTNLVEDILVIPRLEAGQLRLDPTELDLATETHAVAAVVFNDTDYSVVVPSGVTVWADRTRLRQIMRNLLENARKYGGDQVLIEGELVAHGLYAVSVSDNGRGISAEDRERIFQHFEQLSKGDARIQQGVGLGLPIARKLARAMGGDLWYEDRFPVGAKFRFTVRIADHPVDHEDQAATHAHAG